ATWTTANDRDRVGGWVRAARWYQGVEGVVDQGVDLGQREGVVVGFVHPTGSLDVGAGQADEGEDDSTGFERHVSADAPQQRPGIAMRDVMNLWSHDLQRAASALTVRCVVHRPLSVDDDHPRSCRPAMLGLVPTAGGQDREATSWSSWSSRPRSLSSGSTWRGASGSTRRCA